MLAQPVREIQPDSAGMAALVVAKVRAGGFTLAIENDGLAIVPASRLTTEQRAYIRAHKVLLLEELRAELAPVAPEPLPSLTAVADTEAFEERAAILEFEAGFSRDEAERRAMALLAPSPVESAVALPLPVARPEIVCCADCAYSVLPPDTCPVYGWRLCGLGLEGGGGFGRAERRCQTWTN